MFLHYRDQAVNAGDDDLVSGKSAPASGISSMVDVTFAEKVRLVVARRAPTPGEFQDRQVDAKVGLTLGAAHGACALSGHLWPLLAV